MGSGGKREDGRARHRRRAAVVGVGVAAATAFVGVDHTSASPPTSAPPATGSETAAVSTEAPASRLGDAQVVAQGVLQFADDFYQWNVTEHVVDQAGTPFVADTFTFLVAGPGAPLLLGGSDGTRLLLSEGEAAFRHIGTDTLVRSTGGSGSLTLLTLGTTATDTGSDPVAPGAGYHDVDLARDVLADGEALDVPADLRAFAVVTDGTVATSDGGSLDAGSSAVVDGGVSLTNEASDPATVLVAVIGPGIDFESATIAALPTTTAGSAGDPGAPTEPSADQPGEQPTTTAAGGTTSPATTSPGSLTAPATTTTVPPRDTDGDGLADDEEVALGTDVFRADGDGDGLSDPEEVRSFGTNPLSMDSDGDDLNDWEEVRRYGSDPLDPDTDGDTLADGDEVNTFDTNHADADTDGDRLSDPDEINRYGTNARSPDSDGDNASDGREVQLSTDPLDANDYPPGAGG